MKKLALLVCLLVATVAAQAQFEKGKWILNPSISGLGLSHYTLGVGGRYYFSKIGLYLGADVNVDRWDRGTSDDTKFSFGAEAGYAFFLSRTVTLEPAVYWNVNGDRSVFGLKVGFGFYF